MTSHDLRRATLVSGLLLVAALALFRLAPAIDIWTSGLFYEPGTGFLLADARGWSVVRFAVWDAEIAFIVLSLAALVFSLVTGRQLLGLPIRFWLFGILLFAIASGLIVEEGLKAFVGRARPAETLAFGGDKIFAPAASLSDQCQRNCSFVSGEVTSATALALCLLFALRLLRQRLPQSAQMLARIAVMAVPVIVAIQRVGAGRHYLSDAIIALLLTVTIGLLLADRLRLMADA